MSRGLSGLSTLTSSGWTRSRRVTPAVTCRVTAGVPSKQNYLGHLKKMQISRLLVFCDCFFLYALCLLVGSWVHPLACAADSARVSVGHTVEVPVFIRFCQLWRWCFWKFRWCRASWASGVVWCSHPGAMLAVLMRRATTCGHKSLKVWLYFDRLIRSITLPVKILNYYMSWFWWGSWRTGDGRGNTAVFMMLFVSSSLPTSETLIEQLNLLWH